MMSLHRAVLEVTLAYHKDMEAESEAQEYANSSILAFEWGNP